MINIQKHKIIYYKTDPKVIVIENFFDKDTNVLILKDTFKAKEKFKDAGVGKNVINKKMRSNKWWDIQQEDPELKTTNIGNIFTKAIQDSYLHQICKTAFSPINQLENTTRGELQVVTYGNKQEYNYHTDKFALSNHRILTMVYYFFKEPKQFRGGNLEITDGLVYNGKILKQSPKPIVKTINIKNNMLVIFGGSLAHKGTQVLLNNNKFENGKFAITFWIGYQQ